MKTNTPEYARKLRKFHTADRAAWAVVLAGIAIDVSVPWAEFAFKAALAALAILLWWLGKQYEKQLDAMEREE